jgi:crotonyl-CoA carboxylase/reductase
MANFDIGTLPPLGEMPDKMKAIVIRPEREGDPKDSMRLEELPVPEVGPNDVLVLVMAAGVNFNGVWAARGKPMSTAQMHPDEPFHVAGSDASGIVWKVGSAVRRWKVGDEVVLHCNQSCRECSDCNGGDPLACSEQKIWGYETNWGSFAQLCKVQSQQLLRKPKHLSWEESASYGLTLFTAYRMLMAQAEVKPGDHVLIWGAGGGLGVFAIQLCKVAGAVPVAVVSSEDKAKLVRDLGADLIINRNEFDLSKGPNESKRFGKKIRELTDGRDVDVVFEHVGQYTFPTSVLVVRRFGKVVICGATSGYNLTFDVRYLWMRQKRIIGSHFANMHQAEIANRMVIERKIKPVLDQVFEFEDTPRAHQLMFENHHKGKMAIRVQAPRGAPRGT